ncbi:MAG: hypothetical protein VB050_09945 [Geobacteraceae bacterium]|nr:hypothetical protein [Geobacteraceae bacterium]
MEERTHSWIAIRALALLEDLGIEKQLVALLKPHVGKSSVGCWIPDQVDAKRGGAGSSTENHVLKMEPYGRKPSERFVLRKKDLLKQSGPYRMITRFLTDDVSLDADWWGMPFKGDVTKAGHHLPNRIMALSTMMKDLLLMGDQRIDSLIPGDVRFAQYMKPELRTKEEAAAMFFFMISHFVADAGMPCHCDGRKLSAYSEGLHKELEGFWSRKVGLSFERKKLLKEGIEPDVILQSARDIDGSFELTWSSSALPDLREGNDIWLEFIYLCRASFALASIVAPYKQYPYGSDSKAPFDDLFGAGKEKLLDDMSRTVLHDAVLNTAIVWKHIWGKVSRN